MVDNREPLTREDIVQLYPAAFCLLDDISKISPHFEAKAAKLKLVVESQEQLINSLVIQYKSLASKINSLEMLMSGLREDEKPYFKRIDIESLKEKQMLRLQSIYSLLDIDIPALTIGKTNTANTWIEWCRHPDGWKPN